MNAFPCHPDTPSSYDGMTLRDYFAAKAMQAWISSLGPDVLNELEEAGESTFREHAAEVAKLSGWYADAMLKERK